MDSGSEGKNWRAGAGGRHLDNRYKHTHADTHSTNMDTMLAITVEALSEIIETDITPEYGIGEARAWDGQFPPSETRWATPRQIAFDALAELNGIDTDWP